MNKLLASVLCFCLALTQFLSVNALQIDSRLEGKTNIPSEQADYYQAVVEQALAIDENLTGEETEYSIVTVQDTDTRTNLNQSGSQMAIRGIIRNDEQVEVITIIPFHVGNDGRLQNSFEYLRQELETNGTRSSTTTPFVGISVTTNAVYNQYPANFGTMTFYRHIGLSAYWSSSNTTATVSQLYVKFDSHGDAYSYPGVMNANYNTMSNYLVESDYYIASSISKTSPVKGTLYTDYSHDMPTSLVLYCSEYYYDGGSVYISVSYNVNGSSYSNTSSYTAYGS